MASYDVTMLVGAPVVPQFSFSDDIIHEYATHLVRDPHNRYAAALAVCNGDGLSADRLIRETSNNNEFTTLVFKLTQAAAPEDKVKKKEDFMQEVAHLYSNCKNEAVKLKAMEFYASMAGFVTEVQQQTNIQLNVMQVPAMPQTNDVWQSQAVNQQQALQDEASVIDADTQSE